MTWHLSSLTRGHPYKETRFWVKEHFLVGLLGGRLLGEELLTDLSIPDDVLIVCVNYRSPATR